MAQKVGLNIGSGQRPFHSNAEVQWWNVDTQAKWSPDLNCDGSRIPLEDNFVDYVVLHHVLEHFGCGEGAELIKEAHRLLKPGGSLYIFVPNMRQLAVRWLAGKLDTQIYLTNVYGAYMGSEDDRHKWGFDYPAMLNFLSTTCVWDNIRCGDLHTPPGADCAHDWWILEVECVK